MSIFARAIRPYHSSSMSKVGLSTAAISSQLSNSLVPKAVSTCISSGFIYRSCSSSSTSSSCSNSSNYSINNSSTMLARTMLGSCRSPQSQTIRSYVSSNRDGKKKNSRNNSRGNKSGEQNLPDFQSLMRTFYKKAHPDIIRSYDADKAAINDASFQIINNL